MEPCNAHLTIDELQTTVSHSRDPASGSDNFHPFFLNFSVIFQWWNMYSKISQKLPLSLQLLLIIPHLTISSKSAWNRLSSNYLKFSSYTRVVNNTIESNVIMGNQRHLSVCFKVVIMQSDSLATDRALDELPTLKPPEMSHFYSTT